MAKSKYGSHDITSNLKWLMLMNNMGIKAYSIVFYKLIQFSNVPQYYKLILEESTVKCVKHNYDMKSRNSIQLKGTNYSGLISRAVKHWNNLTFDSAQIYLTISLLIN